MISNISPRVAFFLFLFALSLTVKGQEMTREKEEDKRVKRIESQADRIFIRQDFDKAMEIYEMAFQHTLSVEYGATLHLKVARLYLSLLDYVKAVPHYQSAMALSPDLFSPVDVCNYLDALRFSGQRMEAIGIARKYAYRDEYHSDQRYKNILHALNYEDGFLPIGVPEFSVRALGGINTPNSEFWVGEKAGEYFYASSNSRFHDPNKKFYHRSNYYSMDETSEYSIHNQSQERKMLDMIPVGLQNGPMSFSRNMTRIVVTQVHYGKGDRIGMTSQGLNTFQTRLSYSDYNEKRKGWSSFKEVFPQKDGCSYSHPYLFNNDSSLLFSSDMPGGFGGYDIYVVHWNEKKRAWGEPLNLGAQVNTEGDEISPGIFNNTLIFSSDGHVGFGGYDVYGISYEAGSAVSGSLIHFGYPVNTVHNDFSLLHVDKNRGYIVSDREMTSKDDIYYFERNSGIGARDNLLSGMTEARAISSGSIEIMREKGNTNMPLQESLPRSQYAEHVLSVFFDFDSYLLTSEATYTLNTWKNNFDFNVIDTLIIEGYADEMGREDYNQALSEKRAFEVLNWMKRQEIVVNTLAFGRGQTPVHIDFSALLQKYGNKYPELGMIYQNIPFESKIEINQEARRVDVKAIIK